MVHFAMVVGGRSVPFYFEKVRIAVLLQTGGIPNRKQTEFSTPLGILEKLQENASINVRSK